MKDKKDNCKKMADKHLHNIDYAKKSAKKLTDIDDLIFEGEIIKIHSER